MLRRTASPYAARAAVALIAALAGCAAPRAPDAPLRAMLDDARLGRAIEFRHDPGPPDAPPPAADSLSVDQAVYAALATSPAVQQALWRVRAAQAEAWQTRLLPNPVLTVAFRFPETSGKPVIEAGLAGDLVALLQRPGRIEAADARLRAACADVLTVALDLVAEVEERYATAASAEAAVDVLRLRLGLLARLIDLANARLKAGEGTQLDVTTLEAQRVELETEIADRQHDAADDRLAIARLTGAPGGRSDWRLDRSSAAAAAALPPERDLINTATTRRPEVASAEWELAALGADVRLARLAPFDGGDVGLAAERDGVWTLGPALSTPVPLFDWGQARRAKTTAQQVEAGHKWTDQRRRVVEEVRRAYAATLAARATARRVRDELIPLQQRRRDQAESLYRTGNADVTSLLIADNDLQTARAKLVDLDRKAALSLIKLRRAAGGGMPAAATKPATTEPAPRN